MDTALSNLAGEIHRVPGVTDKHIAKIGILDRRQKITEARAARLTENDKREQRKAVEKQLNVRGLWIAGERMLATEKERDATFKWIADYIQIEYSKVVRTDGPPGRGKSPRKQDSPSKRQKI